MRGYARSSPAFVLHLQNLYFKRVADRSALDGD